MPVGRATGPHSVGQAATTWLPWTPESARRTSRSPRLKNAAQPTALWFHNLTLPDFKWPTVVVWCRSDGMRFLPFALCKHQWPEPVSMALLTSTAIASASVRPERPMHIAHCARSWFPMWIRRLPLATQQDASEKLVDQRHAASESAARSVRLDRNLIVTFVVHAPEPNPQCSIIEE